jgi:hypothetical protein
MHGKEIDAYKYFVVNLQVKTPTWTTGHTVCEGTILKYTTVYK